MKSKYESQIIDRWQFDVDTPRFIKEAGENCRGGIYPVCWNMFMKLLYLVAARAAEINDPLMNIMMLRLNLYECDRRSRNKIIDEQIDRLKS